MNRKVRAAPHSRLSRRRAIARRREAQRQADARYAAKRKEKRLQKQQAVDIDQLSKRQPVVDPEDDDETGVDHKTVAKARKAGGEQSPVERTGLDGKTRKLPEKEPEPEADVEPEPPGFTVLDYNGLVKAYEKLQRAHQKLAGKQPLAEGEDDRRVSLDDYLELADRAEKLEARNSGLAAARNAKEARESRTWPPTMTPKQMKKRDGCLRQIALWQRELEKLYGEVTGQPPIAISIDSSINVHGSQNIQIGGQGNVQSLTMDIEKMASS